MMLYSSFLFFTAEGLMMVRRFGLYLLVTGGTTGSPIDCRQIENVFPYAGRGFYFTAHCAAIQCGHALSSLLDCCHNELSTNEALYALDMKMSSVNVLRM